ncbi:MULTISPECIES: AAA family ATPase [Vagococcus]|uniref:Shikimate kinase n=1 Tax=Vagococcus fluvialis bH819 TaxID=1255619 RepID=A0A1X6WLW5_9ENTE|nr:MULTISPECIES: AAA family ATPase [Vagococcus]SLM85333.1 hypothetical protein FM121_04495 [Vagococcus fluvialis bH819]HCM89373.1 hypothetical protein [Vagococcus sp.]
MSLIVLIGPHAVGKMTVGKELEKQIEGKLLFNHQTIDLYANFLGYTEDAFRLSDETRINLFESFVKNIKTNLTKTIIFTVLADFDSSSDIDFLEKIASIFLKEQQVVYFVALNAAVETRIKRNIHENRLQAKPSKQNITFSQNELITSMEKYRLETSLEELQTLFPKVTSMTIDNTCLSPQQVTNKIIKKFNLN